MCSHSTLFIEHVRTYLYLGHHDVKVSKDDHCLDLKCKSLQKHNFRTPVNIVDYEKNGLVFLNYILKRVIS